MNFMDQPRLESVNGHLGENQKRREDPGLITGRTQYVDDIRLGTDRPRIAHMIVLRSPYAHALLGHIDVTEAKSAPGVIAVFTGDDLKDHFSPLDIIPLPGLRTVPHRPLAVGRVRHVGDPVAVILAESRSQAIDARDLVEVDYEPLPAVTDVELAVREDAPLLYEELDNNIAQNQHWSAGNVEEIFAQAEHTAQFRLVNQRLVPSSMETRACLFDYDAERNEFFAWLSSQAIYRAKQDLSKRLGIAPQHVHVRNAAVGGAFGAKSAFTIGEEFVAAWLAHHFARPVKWIEERSENLQAQAQGRGQVNNIEIAFQHNGRLLGMKIQTLGDIGSFSSGIGAMLPNRTSTLATGPYRIEALESTVQVVYTNKPPTAPYRGAGRPEATYIAERAIETVARELGMDAVEVRRRNLIAPDAFPYKTLSGQTYDSGNYPALLNRLLELGEYEQWRARQRLHRAQSSHATSLLGLGLATFNEISGDGQAIEGSPKEAALVRVMRDGSLLVQSGVAHNGQGHMTLFAQLAADVFGITADRVEVELNDADLPVFSIGTFASRVTQVGASVVQIATEAVLEKVLHVASQVLEAARADLELRGGKVTVRGVPGRSVELADLAKMVEERPDLLPVDEQRPPDGQTIEGLAAWRDFAPAGSAFSAGAHMAVVEIDRETGDVTILRYVAVDDCGQVLNHELAEMQLHGALAQGIGQALYEEVLYNEDGQNLSGSLMDYALPLAKGLPKFTSEFLGTPSPTNPLGVKGVGESGTIGAPPTIVNAILDALAPLGVTSIDMPVTPEKLWRLMHP